MKKIYIPIFLLLIAVTANAQSNFAKESKQKMQDFLQKFSSPEQLKSAAESAYALDSITFEDGASKEMTYNDNGLLLTYKYYKNEGGTINLFETETNTYNESGQMLTSGEAAFDYTANAVIDQWKSEYTYNSQGKPETELEWSAAEEAPYALVYDTKTIYTFPDDKALEAMIYDWDNNDWRLEARQLIFGSWGTGTYPMVDSLYIDEPVEGTSDEWFRMTKMYLSYSGDGLLTEMLAIGYDADTGEEIGRSKSKTTYNTIGNAILETTEIYNPGSMSWDLMFKAEFEYNANNQIIREEEFSLDWMTGLLAASSRITYDYDSSGNLETRKEYLYTGEEELKMFYKDEFTFKSLDTENIMLPPGDIGFYGNYTDFYDLEFYENGAIDEVEHYSYSYTDTETDEILERTGKYHYSEHNSIPSSAKQLDNSAIRVFPNPFTDQINLQLDNSGTYLLSINNGIGQVVYTANVTVSSIHDVSSLPSGMYILSLSQNGETKANYKLIKK